MPPTARILTKRLVASGLQCPKRLYLEVREPDLLEEAGAGDALRMREGRRVGEVARGLHPDGVLIDEEDFGAALRRTKALLESGAPAIFEAAITDGRLNMRADILVRAPRGRWDLVEVKSGKSVKPEHVADVAIQRLALEGAGVALRKASVLHLDSGYVHGGGPYDLARLFHAEDVTDDAETIAREVEPALPGLLEVLRRRSAPSVEVGEQCRTPGDCPFLEHCGAADPENSIEELYRLSPRLRAMLEAAGIETIDRIPEGFDGLKPIHERARRSVLSGKPVLERAEARRALEGLDHPLWFMDFETFNPGLPLYAGTRPYDVIPFQWSVHRLDADGTTSHFEFLHDGRDDPRPAFAGSLVEALGKGEGSILIYSPYEKRIMRDTAAAVPRMARGLAALEKRAVDLEPIVRGTYYHPALHGSFSLKSVLPAVAPSLGYDDLDIASGDVAAAAFAEYVEEGLPAREWKRRREALLRYCERDTEALVRVYRVLEGA